MPRAPAPRGLAPLCCHSETSQTVWSGHCQYVAQIKLRGSFLFSGHQGQFLTGGFQGLYNIFLKPLVYYMTWFLKHFKCIKLFCLYFFFFCFELCIAIRIPAVWQHTSGPSTAKTERKAAAHGHVSCPSSALYSCLPFPVCGAEELRTRAGLVRASWVLLTSQHSFPVSVSTLEVTPSFRQIESAQLWTGPWAAGGAEADVLSPQ